MIFDIPSNATGLFWTVYLPIIISFLGGLSLFQIRHRLKMQRIEVQEARESGQTLGTIVSIEDCRESQGRCQEVINKRMGAIFDLQGTDSKELHARVTGLSEEFYETRGALTEAVRAVREGVVASKEAADKAREAAAEAKGIAGEARVLIETIKKVNGYGRIR